jgi:hypothetical protein
VCRTWRLPGAAQNNAPSAASTITVLAVESATARRRLICLREPKVVSAWARPVPSSRGPRPSSMVRA